MLPIVFERDSVPGGMELPAPESPWPELGRDWPELAWVKTWAAWFPACAISRACCFFKSCCYKRKLNSSIYQVRSLGVSEILIWMLWKSLDEKSTHILHFLLSSVFNLSLPELLSGLKLLFMLLKLYLKSPLRSTFWQIFGNRFQDEIILDLFSGAYTGECQIRG